MAAGNTVNVRFAGEDSGFTRTARHVADEGEESAGRLRRSFDRAGEAADSSESKFMGMADVLDGLGGAFGIPTEGATNMMRSFGDLSGGFAILQPAIGGVTSSMKAMGMSMLTNPVFLVVAGVAALAAGLIYAYHHSETFREIVDGAFRAVGDAVGWLWDKAQALFSWFAENWQAIAFVVAAPIAIAVTVISSHWDKIVAGARWIGGVLAGVFDAFVEAAKTQFNFVARLWNNTVGKIGFTVPDWVPGVGGKRFDVPDLPTFHQGGIVPGPIGSDVLIRAQAGETVVPVGQSALGGMGGVNLHVTVQTGQTLATNRDIEDAVGRAVEGVLARGGRIGDRRGRTLQLGTA